jgi:hypothetical protein
LNCPELCTVLFSVFEKVPQSELPIIRKSVHHGEFGRLSLAPVFDLATAIENCPNTNRLPRVIYEAAIPNLKISVGSQIAMMLKPHCHWVGNKRTIWSHLLLKHGMDQRRANRELRLYYQRDEYSEMAYEVWRDLYLRVGPDLLTLSERAAHVARAQGVEPGRLLYLWPDAVATFLFDRFARQ